METSVLLTSVLLLALPAPGSALGPAPGFHGDSISFMTPRRSDGSFQVTFHRRLNGRGDCQNQSSFSCDGGACTGFQESPVQVTELDGSGRWCQSERRNTVTVSPNDTTLVLRSSGCCWLSNLENANNWTSRAELDLGTRSDSRSVNRCPVTATVASLRVPQNCFTKVDLLAHDPDGDTVKCRFAADAAVPANFSLDERTCTLTRAGPVQEGVHVFVLTLQDFPTGNITLTYPGGASVVRDPADPEEPPLCTVTLHFSLEVLPQIPQCEPGQVLPMFLSRTPSQGSVLHATMGEPFQLEVQAQARQSSIQIFQVSGPANTTRVETVGTMGTRTLRLTWTPGPGDLYRQVPVCFTAETAWSQSEMRCVVVMVTRFSITQGKAIVNCFPNKMTVALEKASMPDIDENFLQLRDPSCSLTSNATHIMGTMTFGACGTKLEDGGDFIVFKNQINSFMKPDEIIVRRKTVKVDFSCEFPKTVSISSYYTLHKSDYIFTESSFGSFGYTFEIFRDSNFSTRVEAGEYPVEVKLLQTIYMGIQANADLPNVTLFVESCKATPDDDPDNAFSYDIIKNGCLEDETVQVHSSDPTAFNFEVQAFKFTGDFDQVYITCSVILCEPGSPFSRCAQGCLKDPARRRRDLNKETGGHFITQGPFQFVGPSLGEADEEQELTRGKAVVAASPELRSGEGWGFRSVLTSNVTAVVFGCGFLVSLVLLAVVVRHYRRRRKTEDRNHLIESES
ncbi:uncharacterized protein LOC133418534 [Cololabis saira]|uniref:uncharacterized protein LOC133418534 n=1 Tax=Cololabis saira TaxID=129043 RepID=UPI002AD3A3BB|nr:uncharacterized protein LOC133418534 [Cololabis saira]